MINYDDNPNWPKTNYHLRKISIIEGSGFGKTNALFNLIKQHNDDSYNIIDKIYLHVKDPNEAKYQHLIEKDGHIGLEEHEDPNTFIEYSNNMEDV